MRKRVKISDKQKHQFSAMQWGVIPFTLHGLPSMYLFQSLKEAKRFAMERLEIWDDPRSEYFIDHVRVYKITTTPVGEQIGMSVTNRSVRYDDATS